MWIVWCVCVCEFVCGECACGMCVVYEYVWCLRVVFCVSCLCVVRAFVLCTVVCVV